MQSVAALSLDGGAFLALSELFLLREIMNRLQIVLNLDSTPFPCDHFDVIGGSGSGGLLALLLGRLRMSVETTIEHFIRFYRGLYQPNLDKFQRSSHISETFKALCQEQTMMEHNAACKTFVCATPAASVMGSRPELFRNYTARKYASFDCKIWQAAQATIAYPSVFDAISIGLGWRSVSYVNSCAFGFGNPITLVVDEAKSLHPSSKEWLFLSLGAGHPGIFGVPSSGDECSSLLKGLAEDCERIAEKMDESGQHGYVRLNVMQGFQGIKPHELTDPGIIATHTRHYAAGTMVDNRLDDIVDFLANRYRQSSGSSTPHSLIQNLSNLISHLPDLDPWDFELDNELIVRRNYCFYIGRVHAERRVVVQVFEGDHSQEHRDVTLYANIILKHPNLLVVFRKSSTSLTDPCIFFSGPLLPANTQLSQALNNSNIGNLVFQGISLIKDLASALAFLQVKSRSFLNSGLYIPLIDFVVFAKPEGQFILAFTPALKPAHEETHFGPSLLQDICSETVIQATLIAHNEEMHRNSLIHNMEDNSDVPYKDLAYPATFEEETKRVERPSLSSSKQRPPERFSDQERFSSLHLKDESDMRIFTWQNQNTFPLTLTSIAEAFKKLVERNRRAVALRRIFQVSTLSLRECPGYRRDEVRLSLRADSNAIIVHDTPFSDELCIGCGKYHQLPIADIVDHLDEQYPSAKSSSSGHYEANRSSTSKSFVTIQSLNAEWGSVDEHTFAFHEAWMPPSNSPGRGERSPLPHSLISRPREDASSQYLASSAGCTKSVVNMTHSGNSVPHRSSTSSGGIPRRLALKINSYLQGKSHNQDNHVASMNLFPATPFRMHPVLAYTICYDVMYPPTPLTVVDRNTRASVPPQTLQQPATDPVTLSRLVLTSDKFPWLVVARSRPGNSNNSRPSGKSFFKKRSPSNAILSSAPVTNFDVLRSLHETLYMRVTQEEWDALGSRKRMKIWKAHEARCEPAGDGGMADIRRVDYLGEETILVGVEVDGLTEGGRLVFARPYPAAKNRDKPTMPSIVMIKDHSNEKICIINQM